MKDSNQNELEKTLKSLIKNIDSLNDKIQKEISFKRSFFLSILR